MVTVKRDVFIETTEGDVTVRKPYGTDQISVTIVYKVANNLVEDSHFTLSRLEAKQLAKGLDDVLQTYANETYGRQR